MKLYLVYYWMPFPSSEYGGLECVIARDVEHCVEILANEVGEYSRSQYPNYLDLIRLEVRSAKSYELSNSKLEAGIVESFTT